MDDILAAGVPPSLSMKEVISKLRCQCGNSPESVMAEEVWAKRKYGGSQPIEDLSYMLPERREEAA